MTQQLVNSVRKYLASQHMLAVEEWVTGFVEYLMENNDGNCIEKDVQNLAKEQWLLNDLKDICPGSLPGNLRSQQKITLNGRFVLQINAAVDIGTPAYQQYLKLQKVNMENIEATTNFDEKISSHRMIKLYLTDGVQEVSAIEYRPMRNISCDVTPGCKVLIKGPIDCRRGVLLLTESHAQLLGGEVQELAGCGSLASLLAAKLGLPVPRDENNTENSVIHTSTAETHTPVSNSDRIVEPTFEQTSRLEARSSNQVTEAFVDDDFDINQLAAIEAQFTENRGKRPMNDNNSRPDKKAKTTVNNVDDYPDDEDLIMEDEAYLREMETQFNAHDSRVSGCGNRVSIPMSRAETNPVPIKNIEEYPTDEDLLMEDEDCIREIEAKFDARDIEINARVNKVPITVPVEPFVYIKQINELSEAERSGKVFKVKGQIMKLLSKLSVGKDGWSLRCAIVDGTGSLDVDFTSDVLSKLVGYTPLEMNEIKKEMAKKPEIKEKAISALQKAKENLQILYCIIELTMLDGPKITQLIPFDETHAHLLKKRQMPSTL